MTYKSWIKQYANGIDDRAAFAQRILEDAKNNPRYWDMPSNKFDNRYRVTREHLQELGGVDLDIFKDTWDEWEKEERKKASDRRKHERNKR